MRGRLRKLPGRAPLGRLRPAAAGLFLAAAALACDGGSGQAEEAAPASSAEAAGASGPAVEGGFELTVLDAASGRPLEGISVVLVVQRGPSDGVRKHHVTGPDGRAFFPIQEPGTLLGLRFEPTARTPPFSESLALAVLPGERHEHTVHLPPAAILSGQVVDETGAPFAGEGEVHGWFLDRWQVEGEDSPPPSVTAPLQAGGRFAIGGFPAGPFTLEAIAEGRTCTRRAGGVLETGEVQEGLSLKLVPAHVLVGEVVDPEGRPVEGALVGTGRRNRDEKARPGPAEGVWYYPERQWILRTDASGGFTVPRIPTTSDKWRYTVRHPAYRPKSGRLDAGVRSVRIVLEPGAEVHGLATDAEGRPLAGVRLILRGQGPLYQMETGEDGAFHFAGLKETPWNLLLGWKPGFAPAVLWPLASPPADGAAVRLVLEPGRELHGRITDPETGEGIPDLAVEIEPGPEPPADLAEFYPGRSPEATFGLERAQTDAEGRFRFRHLRDREYRLRILDPSTRTPAREVPVRPGAEELQLSWEAGAAGENSRR